MVTDNQVRILMKVVNQEKLLKTAAAKAGMSEKTARKYLKSGRLPSQCKVVHDWRTRPDPFDQDDWRWVEEVLENNNGIEAKTLFEVLQREHPGKYQDGQLRTFQRRVKLWRALKGPGNEIFFPQVYKPGEWCESDFTRMKPLGITINGVPFDHMLYHFVLCYSNWEAGTICFSESYESLSAGLQNALWKLGGTPKYHRTDNLTSAVNPVGNPQVFTDKYLALAKHYGFESHKIQPGCPNENGDIEKRHDRLKKKDDLFPTSQFRIAYDLLRSQYGPKQANKHYLRILRLAAQNSETLVNESLRFLVRRGDEIDYRTIETMVESGLRPPAVTDVQIERIDLSIYDQLLEYQEAPAV